jgi:hypothetical protein
MGEQMALLRQKMSCMMVRVDGVDQAKFRCPRVLEKTHHFDRLIRPALHLQGIWCHHFGFHFAVADADMKKDTNSNVHVLAQMLESVVAQYGAVPQTLVVVQDNTSRECKNSLILRWATKLVALNVFRGVILAYAVKGHTHGPLDAVFGQAVVKLGNSEFQDPTELIHILQGFLDEASLETGAKDNARAYKMDEAARWDEWWQDVDVRFEAVTGPRAPHWFHITQRRNFSMEELRACGNDQGHLDDIMVIVKERMCSYHPYQVACVLPGAELGMWRLRATAQPSGIAARRSLLSADRVRIVQRAESAAQAGVITARASQYLCEWAKQTLRRAPRPRCYEFLSWRAGEETFARLTHLTAAVTSEPGLEAEPRPIVVRRDPAAGGTCEEENPEADVGPLAVQEDLQSDL